MYGFDCTEPGAQPGAIYPLRADMMPRATLKVVIFVKRYSSYPL